MNGDQQNPEDKANTLGQWGRYLLEEVKRINRVVESMDAKIDQLAIQLAMLNVKAGVWGVMGGAVTIALALLLQWVARR